jgi:hypothetical protein
MSKRKHLQRHAQAPVEAAEDPEVVALAMRVDKVLSGHDVALVMCALACLLIHTIQSAEDDAEFKEYIRKTTLWIDGLVTDRFGSGGAA